MKSQDAIKYAVIGLALYVLYQYEINGVDVTGGLLSKLLPLPAGTGAIPAGAGTSAAGGAPLQTTAIITATPAPVVTPPASGAFGGRAVVRGEPGGAGTGPAVKAAAIRALGGNAGTADQWNVFLAQITGKVPPAPEDFGFTGAQRNAVVTFEQYWSQLQASGWLTTNGLAGLRGWGGGAGWGAIQ